MSGRCNARLAAEVEGGRSLLRPAGLVLGNARAHGGVAPQDAAGGHERPGVLRLRPLGLLGGRVAARRHVVGQAEQREVPADADRARSVLRPVARVALGRVDERELRARVTVRLAPDGDVRGHAAELPGGGEAVGWIARLDRPARVPLDLEAAAEPEVAADRGEPASQPLGSRAGVPQIRDVRRVGLAEADGGADGAVAVAVPRADGPLDGVQLAAGLDPVVDHRLSLSSVDCCRRARLPRAISVSSAARRGVQKRRNPSSQASTSRNGSASTAYRRRAPCGRTLAYPFSRRTRRCCDTAGWLIPNSSWTTPARSPADRAPSPSDISSSRRRRTGSPRTSNPCTS